MNSQSNQIGAGRHYLLLQGPHGPFFQQLGRLLCTTGAKVTRVGFNAGDQAFWRDRSRYVAYDGPIKNWSDTLAQLIKTREISDLVLYGDTREIHAHAVEIARQCGLEIHIFEEGYLRPFWVTYERGGSNGNSRLMDTSLADIRHLLARGNHDQVAVPDYWGDMREHMFYGALYHWFVLFRNRKYTHFKPHRALSVGQEFSLYLKRLTLMPVHWAARIRATFKIKRGGFAYHLALLQLDHDSSFRAHSPFASTLDFLRLVIENFANGAPSHHHLVFKAHPLEDGRVPLRREIVKIATQQGIRGRVHFVRGGKLAALLDGAKSAVTVNSTAAQQALWRGLPLFAFGDAVYCKPEFVSTQPLADFFANPAPPDVSAYRDYRQFLLETSQVPGGFYAGANRRQLLRNVVDMMLDPLDPYDAIRRQKATPKQQLPVVNQDRAKA